MRLSILVVDDNRDTLRTYVKALLRRFPGEPVRSGRAPELEQSNVNVDEADTVKGALEKLRKYTFHVVVVDLKIPGIAGQEWGGLEIVSESLRLDPLRSVIVITGYGTVQLARDTLKQGAFDFIEKSPTAVDEMVDAVERAVEHRRANMIRYGNPFSRMTDEEPPVFGGRTEELEFFQERLVRAASSRFREHFLVLGDWGIGKSTLLREYKRICQARGSVAAIVRLQSLGAGATVGDAARSIVEGILRDLPYPVNRLKKLTDFFESAGVTVLGTGIQFARRGAETHVLAQSFLHDSLARLWADLENETDTVAILLDDLDNVASVPEIVMTLKQTLSMDAVRNTRILVGFSCPSPFWSQLASAKKHHPLARYFMHHVELEPLTAEEVRDTVMRSLHKTGVSFDRQVVDRIYETTGGHPFEMQVLCHHLFNNQLSGLVGSAVWEKSLEGAVKDLGFAVFTAKFKAASPDEAKVLRAVAETDTPASISDIEKWLAARRLGVKRDSVPKYLQRLREKGLVQRAARGQYFISDCLFRVYVRMQFDSA